MSTWEDDLVTRLAADAGVALRVGDRISWTERRGALPGITLTRIAPGRSYNHSGANSHHEPRVQIDIWATSPAEAGLIELAVIACLEPAATIGSTKFGRAFLNGSPDLPPDDLDGGVKAYRRAPDFTLWHEPA